MNNFSNLIRTRANLLSLLLLLPFSGLSEAAIWCMGDITASYIDGSGNFFVRPDFRNDYLGVCNVEGDASVSSIHCSHWVAMMNTAVAENQTVIMFYGGSNYTCANLPTYLGAPTPDYVMLCDDTGGTSC